MADGVGPAALSDALLDSFCLIGPTPRCRERLAEFREAGVDLPILNPPVGPEAALAVIRTFKFDAAPATQPGRRPKPRHRRARPPVNSHAIRLSRSAGYQGTERHDARCVRHLHRVCNGGPAKPGPSGDLLATRVHPCRAGGSGCKPLFVGSNPVPPTSACL